MFEEIKNITSTKKDLRNFAIVFAVIFIAIGIFLFFNDNDAYLIYIYISLTLIFVGFALPKILKPFYYVWMIFGVIVGWFMTRFILTLLFYFIVTPIGIIARLLNKEFLDRKINYGVKSYWSKRTPHYMDKEYIEKQF